ncbi:MAG TPA: carboxypeptidase-like regulatory domain-containing protein, partial [Chitinophagaceae bacterium]
MNKSLLLIPLLILLLTGIPFCATAQQRTVTGTVYDDQGAPLPGATVRVKEAADEVTVTNDKGKFILPLGENAKTLVVTFIGMQEREIAVNHQSTFKIMLRNASNTLSDVVVIGYGTVKKSDLTGSV